MVTVSCHLVWAAERAISHKTMAIIGRIDYRIRPPTETETRPNPGTEPRNPGTPEPRNPRKYHALVSTVVTVLAGLAGAVLLYWQIQQTGLDEIGRSFAAVHWWGFALILLLSLGRFAARTLAWMTLAGPGGSFRRALAATIGGDALGNLTPLSVIVSEPAKAMYLAGPAGAARALAALAAENFFYTVSVAIYIMLGTAAMLEAFPLSDAVARAGVIALVVMAAVLAAAAWLAWQRPSVASALLARLPNPRLQRLADRVHDFELQAYGSVGGHTGQMATLAFWEVTFHVLSFVEAWLTLWLLTGSSLPLQAFVLDTFQRVANIIFKVIPFGLGVTQVGSEIVARATGIPPAAGVTMALIVTARKMVWAAVGVWLLVRRGLKSRPSGAR